MYYAEMPVVSRTQNGQPPLEAVTSHTGTELPIELRELAPETRVSVEAEAINQVQGV